MYVRPLLRRLAALIGALALLASGCAADDERGSTTATAPAPTTVPRPAPVQQLDVTGTEYAFAFRPDPATTKVRAGWTALRFDNRGGEAHQVMFARVKDGVDVDQLAAAGAGDSSGAGAIEFVDMLGGVSYIGPGQEITAMVELPEGLVIAMCYVPDVNGVAHALHGMTTMLTVQAASDSTASTSAVTRPDRGAVGTIRMTDAGYEIPNPMTPGWHHVVNTDDGPPGTGLHELAILRLERPVADDELDQLANDLASNAEPSVGVEALGGLGAISPGFEGYVNLNLPPGEYLAVDFMPDARNPRPHLLDGYYATFRVRSSPGGTGIAP